MVLVGDNSLISTLRILTSIELFMHADFYSNHPLFSSIVSKHGEYFSKTMKNLLPLSVSQECLNTGLTEDALVKKEAILNCCDKKWSSFLCILGLASVLGREINSYYPDCGEKRKYMLLNCHIFPRVHFSKALDALNILFCYEGVIKPGLVFQPNHFVPIVFHCRNIKRKLANELISSKKPKTSKPSQFEILNFFPKAQKNVVSVDVHFKAPNECFSSQEALTSELQLNACSGKVQNTSTSECKVDPKCSVLSTDNRLNSVVPVNNFDVATYRKKVKGMKSSAIYNLIKNVFKPDKQYSFPQRLCGKQYSRSFKHE